ncbi:zinc-binding protein A33-like [Hemitrygon akajei]|uniref:zinc-binding protein A33-like n=1 Tax=Hemitrygon akajei TaxID=2704970 RepID=UPI003BFA21CD
MAEFSETLLSVVAGLGAHKDGRGFPSRLGPVTLNALVLPVQRADTLSDCSVEPSATTAGQIRAPSSADRSGRDAQEHREHRFMPIKEAVKTYKDQLKSSLDSLTKKKSDFQEKEQQQKEKISGVLEQSHSLQSHITSQFAELRQIITEKEQSLLRDLREEVKRILNPMEKNLREIQKNIRIIQEEISKLKEQMDQKDSVIFLKEEARRNRRINDNVQELSVTDETLPVEKFDHPYLLKTVLRETLDAINRGMMFWPSLNFD